MKSPAIMFYTSDFLTGTSFMDNEQTGAYIKLLCLQHQLGHIPKKDFEKITKDKCVLSKFLLDKDNKYYNERMEIEIEKRDKFIEHQRENGLKGGRPNNPRVSHGLAKQKPLEDDNDNINNIITYYSSNIHTITPIEYEKLTKWEETFSQDMIKYAIELAVKANARSFNYIEAIFKSWKTKGYKTIIDIERLDKKKKERELPSWFNEEIKREEPEMTEEERKEIDDIVKSFEEFEKEKEK